MPLLAQLLSPSPDQAGSAMIAVLCLAALAIIGSYTFAFIAHVFFAVAEATAAGQDDVAWPDETIVDRLGKAVIFLWFGVIALFPAFAIAWSVTHGPSAYLFAGCIFAIALPVVMLSAQSCGSWLAVIYPPMIARLFRRFDLVMAYYFASVWVCIACAFAAFVIHAKHAALVPLAAIVIGWGVMTMARLYGRLALRISRVAGPKSRPRPAPVRKAKQKRALANDPWAMPSELPDFSADPESAYALRDKNESEPESAPAHPSLKRIWIEEDDDGMPHAVGDEIARPELPGDLGKPSAREMALAAGGRPPKLPTHTWIGGTYSFALRPTSLSRWASIALGVTLAGYCWRTVVSAL